MRGEVGVVVGCEGGDELDDGAADERIAVILERQDLVADFGVPVVHELQAKMSVRSCRNGSDRIGSRTILPSRKSSL